MDVPPRRDELDDLNAFIRPYPPTTLVPEAFFVARSGVFTLAFAGFPASLLALKRDLEVAFPALIPENPGSQWPKTTLACLRDGRRLTMHEVTRLQALCEAFNRRLHAERQPLAIDALSVVQYACRSLEERRHVRRIALEGAPRPDPIPAAHQAYVRAVLAQFAQTNLPKYLPHLSRTDHDLGHYRCRAEGTTLVAPVPPGYLPLLAEVAQALEAALPGWYAWFAPESRHLTIRSLIRRKIIPTDLP